jgi:hypothetical protein
MNIRKAILILSWLGLAFSAIVGRVASAAAQRLDCTLTDRNAQTGVEHRALIIVFDEDAATMQWQEGKRIRDLTDVSISTTSMSGGERAMTIGISRSSWRIVLQTYQKNAVRTEFGVCAVSPASDPGSLVAAGSRRDAGGGRRDRLLARRQGSRSQLRHRPALRCTTQRK